MCSFGYFIIVLSYECMFIGKSYAFLPLMSETTPNDCAVECEEVDEGKPRLVCGNDGRTYDTRCAIERAKCEGHPVEMKHWGKCSEKARCEAQRSSILEQGSRMSMFVPECKDDGSYAEVQCHKSTGYCWCVDKNGKPVRGSSVRHIRPNCSQSGRRSNRRRSSRGRRQKKGCTNGDRASFNANLIGIFESEYNRLPHTPLTTSSGVESDPLMDTYEKAVIQWKFDQLDENGDNYLKKKEVRDLRKMAKKIVKPKLCAKTFAKYCDLDQDKKISRSEWSICVGVDINYEPMSALDHILDDAPKASDAMKSLSVRPEQWDRKQMPHLRHNVKIASDEDETLDVKEEELQDCTTARLLALENHKQDPDAGVYIPECNVEGLYIRTQCHKSPQFCWCVHPRTGKPIRGTAANGVKPDCDSARRGAKSFKGCSIHKKQEFLDELVQSFIKEMMEDAKNRSLSIETPTHEKAARWKFSSVDSNDNKNLDKREWKVFKNEWKLFHRDMKQRRRLRKCWRNLPRFCDENSDQKISMDEWLTCTGITRDFKGVPLLPSSKRTGPNPFSTILKSD